MAELHESSLLFSLDSLLAHERQRVDEEHEAAERRRLAVIDAAVAAERAALAEQARKAAEARELRLAEERRQLDEAARLEGIKQAELERARRETELKSATELAARREHHELALATAHATARAKTARSLLFGTASLAVLATLGAVGVALFAHRADPSIRTDGADVANRASIEQMRGLLGAAERQRQALLAELERRTQTAAPPPAVSARPTPTARPARPPSHLGTTHVVKPCTGDPHDPLNPCLGS